VSPLPRQIVDTPVNAAQKGHAMLVFHRALALAGLALVALAQPGWAQSSGSQTVTFVVGFAPGGAADVIARLVAQRLGDRFGRKAVVENRGGAGGNIAARAVSAAAPDGASILVTTSGIAVAETTSRNKGFSTDDLRTVAIPASGPDLLAVHPSNPAKNMGEFVTNAKDKNITFGTPGVGTTPAIAAEYFFKEVAKIKAVHVPYTGGAPAVAAGIGNHIDLVVASVPTASAQVNDGLLRGIGIPTPARSASVPSVPTYAEGGYPDFFSSIWVGFFAPVKTPDEVVARLNAEINEIMKEPEAQQKLKSLGFEPMLKTTAEANAFLKSEVEKWGKMSRAIGFSTD
jgi:tripartite-type tricarboxylate transporter receptor subunit TctC